MDEPFGAFDPVTRRQLQDEFRSTQSRLRKTVLLVTHDVAEATALADRIGVIETGQLIWCGPPRAIGQAPDPRVRRFVKAVTVRPLSGAGALSSTVLVVDACRHIVRQPGEVVSLTTRPVLFALVRALGEACPQGVSRDVLSAARARRSRSGGKLRAIRRRK